nr:uncharacterized protein [Candida metapsilosis]
MLPRNSHSHGTMGHYTLLSRLLSAKTIKVVLTLVIIFNLIFITSQLFDSRSSKSRKKKSFVSKVILPKLSSKKKSSKVITLKPAPNHKLRYHQGLGGASLDDIPKVIEVENSEISFTSELQQQQQQQLYPIPNKPYEDLDDDEKILYMLNQVRKDKKKYWLGHTELTDYEIKVNVKDFLPENWIDKPVLFYDPRFTLSLYLSEIRNQYLTKNPENSPHYRNEIVVPFAWSDWVDLTMLNQELVKPEKKRKTCEYMKATHHIPTKVRDYCINNVDIGGAELDEMKLPSIDYVPGSAVKKSPTNKATNEVRMLEGKSHLLTYAANPLAVMFLSKDGVYEAKIDEKQRIVDGQLFENYLSRNNIARDSATSITLNPVKEFHLLSKQVKPTILDPEEDEYGLYAKSKESSGDSTTSREIYLPQSAFDYQQDAIDAQIKHYQKRLHILHDLTTNELTFNQQVINEVRLQRNEKMYYDGLRFANRYPLKKEPTHFRMARLKFGNAENDHDAGWHYEWRFFNGALRFMKTGWTKEELLIREKVLLDRILRNWFKFASLKGVVSWIAHGPLLSWYWDGLLFPFDEDIDIQMPAKELAKFCKYYNQTLVVEDINEGFGKYFIECSSFIHHRGKSYKENHIDARFIDIDTGSYIDITGLGISDEPVPERYDSLIEQDVLEIDGEDDSIEVAKKTSRRVYNCRFPHFYSHDEISPLRYTMLGGVPVYVPNKIETILQQEYKLGLTSYSYDGFFFVDALNLWIHYSKLEFLFPKKEIYINTYNYKQRQLNIPRFTELVQNITQSQVVELLTKDEDILLEYYLTKNVTDLHKLELTHLFDLPNGVDGKIGDIKGMRSQEEISSDEGYHELTSKFTFQTPFRRSLFNYEMIDRPKHHH